MLPPPLPAEPATLVPPEPLEPPFTERPWVGVPPVVPMAPPVGPMVPPVVPVAPPVVPVVPPVGPAVPPVVAVAPPVVPVAPPVIAAPPAPGPGGSADSSRLHPAYTMNGVASDRYRADFIWGISWCGGKLVQWPRKTEHYPETRPLVRPRRTGASRAPIRAADVHAVQ